MSQPQPYRSQRALDLALLADGIETGWWDHTGRPAPWPEDFWLADDTINPAWTTSTDHHREEHTDTEPHDHPF